MLILPKEAPHINRTKSHMKQLRPIFFLICAMLIGCATLPTHTETYSGEYFYNFEHAYLTPDGQNEHWCLKGDMSKAELSSHGGEGPSGTSHVTVQGRLGPKGRYGNLGICKRILTVTKLLRVSNSRSNNE